MVQGEQQGSWPVLQSLDYRATAVGANALKSRYNKKGGFEQNCYPEIKQSQFGSVSRSETSAAGPRLGRGWAVSAGPRGAPSLSWNLSRRGLGRPQGLSQDVSDNVSDSRPPGTRILHVPPQVPPLKGAPGGVDRLSGSEAG